MPNILTIENQPIKQKAGTLAMLSMATKQQQNQ